MSNTQHLGPAGRRLFDAVSTDYELSEHERRLLAEAAATADLLDDLGAVVRAEGTMLDGKLHPAVVELRQQRILLARLLVALRVPIGDGEDEQRPQRRGTRGAHVRGAA